MDWLYTIGLALIVGAALRVRTLSKTAAYLLYAAGGLALVSPCFCNVAEDLTRVAGPYDPEGPIAVARLALETARDLLVVVLMIAGLVVAARALPSPTPPSESA